MQCVIAEEELEVRSFIVALCIGILMVGGCVLYMVEVEDISQRLSDMNGKVTDCIENEDYESAASELSKLSKYFDEKIIMLAATGNHTELDQIQIYISQAYEYVEARHRGDALAICKSMNIMFEHLPKNYRLRPENIL